MRYDELLLRDPPILLYVDLIKASLHNLAINFFVLLVSYLFLVFDSDKASFLLKFLDFSYGKQELNSFHKVTSLAYHFNDIDFFLKTTHGSFDPFLTLASFAAFA